MGGGASSRQPPTLALMGMQMPSVLLARRRPGLPRVTSWASLGWVGALFATLVGPFAHSLGVAQAEPPSAWLTRLAAYGGIGLLLGWLFDTARGALADAHGGAERGGAHPRDNMPPPPPTSHAK